MQKQYKNYVFDLYGTLVDVLTDEESQRLWTSFAWYLKLLGLPAEAGSLRADYLRLCAEAQRAKADMLMAKGIEGPYEADILTVWQALGNEKGMRLTIRQATEISRVFRALSLRRLGLFPGAAEVLVGWTRPLTRYLFRATRALKSRRPRFSVCFGRRGSGRRIPSWSAMTAGAIAGELPKQAWTAFIYIPNNLPRMNRYCPKIVIESER